MAGGPDGGGFGAGASGTSQAATDDAGAKYLRESGSYAQRQAYLNAGIDVLGAASKWGGGSGGGGSLGSGGMGPPVGAATGALY